MRKRSREQLQIDEAYIFRKVKLMGPKWNSTVFRKVKLVANLLDTPKGLETRDWRRRGAHPYTSCPTVFTYLKNKYKAMLSAFSVGLPDVKYDPDTASRPPGSPGGSDMIGGSAIAGAVAVHKASWNEARDLLSNSIRRCNERSEQPDDPSKDE